MSKFSEAIHGIYHLDALAKQDNMLTRVHPLTKVLISFLYIICVLSYDKYNITGLMGMSLYLIVFMTIANISYNKVLKNSKELILTVFVLGIVNPLFDKSVMFSMGGFNITGGMVSMLTLILKSVFTLLSSYLLIATTSIENICYALRLMHVPKILVTVIMLMYRYITLFVKEVERISLAYSLRAPGQKGIHYRAWGTLAGQMLLRSIDRAENVYESMTIRGFKREFYMEESLDYGTAQKRNSILYFASAGTFIILFRFIPVFELIGRIFS